MKLYMHGIMVLALSSALAAAQAASKEQVLTYGAFGDVTLYGTENRNSPDFVIFLSGDGGWKKGVVDMAKQLAGQGAVVAAVDVVHYLNRAAQAKASCTYAAADFENLGKFVQRKLQFSLYRKPLLLGYSSGATLVYALLAQAPNGTFRGGLSLGFCNDLTLAKPLCARNDLSWKTGAKKNTYLFDASERIEDPWRVLNGQDDKVCPEYSVRKFVTATRTGAVAFLPKVGHGFANPRHWMPQYLAEYRKLAAPAAAVKRDAAVEDLPLIEELPERSRSEFFTILLTGDGGWAGIDKRIAENLAAQGVPVIGWNSLQYLWHPKTPDQAAKDLYRVIVHYGLRLGISRVRLLGYSLGADLLPFMVNRLPPDVLNKVERIILLGPSRSVSFEFHASEWFDSSAGGEEKPTRPELQKIRRAQVYCVYGQEEQDSLCLEKDLNVGRSIPMKGGHHFGGDYEAISNLVLQPN